MINSIFFDFDGTLCDSMKVKALAFVDLYSEYSEDIRNKILKYHLQNIGESRFEKFRFFEEEILKNKITDSKMEELSDRFSLIVKEMVIMANEISGATAMLRRLNDNKITCFIVSATPDKEIKEIIYKKKWDVFFKEVLGSPTEKSKLIKSLMYKYKINSEDGLVIGDTISDYNAAKKNNLQFIAVKSAENTINFPQYIKIIDNFDNFNL